MASQTLPTSDYGKSSKQLIEFVGQLRALGAHIDLELPRIVVIGNQSAGKSSLVEAISGINVPRDAGTCTRCPMECRLSYAEGEWSCQIKIRWEYDESGKDSTRVEEVKEVSFGPLLTDKSQVEPMLRRAQTAVLNPHIPEEKFVDMGQEKLKATKVEGQKSLLFSRNVVCIELAGPDLVDLSFVDLPGIVQNAEAETVQLVEDLVKSYIQGTSLILVTLPMSDDIENQKAARLAKLADPQGLRTIGVLTKPDMLTAGATKARDLWLEVLEGQRHPLCHGYYCTRQPDDDERSKGISAAEARAAEAAFFQATAPWASSTQRDRFGTLSLVKSISKLLTQIIQESLPSLLEKVSDQLNSCNEQLAKLPPAITTESTAFVVALLTKFTSELDHCIRGSPTSTELVQGTRKIYESFRYAIRSSAPPFVPYKNADYAPKDISDYVRADPQDRSARNKRFTGKVMYLDDVRRHIHAYVAPVPISVTRELHGNVPYAAKVSLFLDFQNTWKGSAGSCFDRVQEVFQSALSNLIQEYFERYGNLMAIVRPVAAELIHLCAERTTTQMHMLLQLESTPFTQNNHYLSECRDKWLAKYKDARAGKGPAERVNPAAAPPPISARPSLFSPSSTPAPASAFAGPFFGLPASSASPGPGAFGPLAANSTGSSTAKQPAKGSAEKQKPVEDSPSEGEDTPRANGTKASEFTFSSAFGGGQRAPPATTPPIDPARQELLRDTLANLAKLGYAGLMEVDLGKLNPPDIYEEELAVMAEARAYFQVAYKRVIDYIPLCIDHHFLYAFVTQLQQLLFERLALGTPNAAARCTNYIAEDPSMVSIRDELTSKKKRLENVQRALFNFGL